MSEDNLRELQAQMNALVARRTKAMEEAAAIIADANREFDRLAVPLGKKIARLTSEAVRTAMAPTPPKRRKPVSPPPDDWTEEEKTHYYELIGK